MTTEYRVPILDKWEWQEPVLDKDLTSPPGGESKGDRYLIYGTGSGDWTGQGGSIAEYNGAVWIFITKREGMVVYVKDEDEWYKYITSWGVGAFGTSGYSGMSGASGISGASGLSGLSGDSGISGESGYSGLAGVAGTAGVSGMSGASGASGYSGLSGLSGESGAVGTSGASGYSGLSGLSGIDGSSGYSGLSGLSGTSGASGYSGLSGLSGESGASGLSGISGATAESGYSGLSGSSGFSGQGGANFVWAQTGASATWVVVHNLGYKEVLVEVFDNTDAQIIPLTVVWDSTSQCTLTFESAITGKAVVSSGGGVSGYSGLSGASGYSGLSGAPDTGESGYSGMSGASGASGYSGLSGLSGESGAVGTSGYSGLSGATGSSGISGATAASGYSGLSGASGYSGLSGIGTSGYSGISGAGGAAGSLLRTLIFPAACFETRTGTSGWAGFAQTQGTNFDYGEIDFDTGTVAADEKAISPPFFMEDYDGGNITITIGWKATATEGTVAWVASFCGIADDEPWDAALTDHAFATDTPGGTAEDMVITILVVDPAELAANEATVMKIWRDTSEDNMAGDAKLLWVQLEYSRA